MRRFGMLVFLVDKSPARDRLRSGVLVLFNSAETSKTKYRIDEIS